jgi:hypothetical protein
MGKIPNAFDLFIKEYREKLLKEFYSQTTEFVESDGTVRYLRFNPGSEDSFSGWVPQDNEWSEMKERIKELEEEKERNDYDEILRMV